MANRNGIESQQSFDSREEQCQSALHISVGTDQRNMLIKQDCQQARKGNVEHKEEFQTRI
ncbi:hypothetical protein M514_03944 [Trichuris suis]|uniref:Uncharacterized protein n=1 Tax=Trichuris suis TaxID=68888 RepID=A0A085N8V4_9BILA|nr:hypothetical protein M513_03944 [Trichuris suis]KFD65900.1 hypothetical protein M514_03944 [Trichuris suis]